MEGARDESEGRVPAALRGRPPTAWAAPVWVSSFPLRPVGRVADLGSATSLSGDEAPAGGGEGSIFSRNVLFSALPPSAFRF